jgi:hypothetical protein
MSMMVAELRTKLHEYIETTDDSRIEALYTLLENDIEKKHPYSEEQLKLLHEDAAAYFRGEMKTLTIQESFEEARSQRQKK